MIQQTLLLFKKGVLLKPMSILGVDPKSTT